MKTPGVDLERFCQLAHLSYERVVKLMELVGDCTRCSVDAPDYEGIQWAACNAHMPVIHEVLKGEGKFPRFFIDLDTVYDDAGKYRGRP